MRSQGVMNDAPTPISPARIENRKAGHPPCSPLHNRPVESRRLINCFNSSKIFQCFAQMQCWLLSGTQAGGKMFDFQLVLVDALKVLLAHLSALRNKDGGRVNAGCKRHRNGDDTLLADEFGNLTCRYFKAGVDQAEATIAEIQYGVGCHLDAAGVWHIHTRRHSSGRVPEYGTAEIDRIAANIH